MASLSKQPRVLFVSGELIAGDLALRLKREGCEVKLFIEHAEQGQCLDGFIDKTDDWKKELSWVGKDGLIVFDDVGYGEQQDELRQKGYNVVGGSAGGDRLEKDRSFGDQIFRESGLETVPLFDFSDPKKAIDYISKHPGAWVVKQNTHQSALNYVGVLETGEDTISVLASYARKGVRNVTLQQKIKGAEVSINRYFNGGDWVGPSEITIEHKSLFNGEIGPKTGEMGNLMWYDDSEGKLFKRTLDKVKKYLQKVNFRGDIDINSFIDGDQLYPIEFTARFGCPITHSQSVMHISPWNEFLMSVAKGEQYDLKHHEGYCIALTLALPPFPYEGVLDPAFTSEGLEIFFQGGLTVKEKKNIHFEGVFSKREKGRDKLFVAKSIGYTLFVTGRGDTVEKARQNVSSLARKIVIPKIFFRTDIGAKFEKEYAPTLKQHGWI